MGPTNSPVPGLKRVPGLLRTPLLTLSINKVKLVLKEDDEQGEEL